MDRFLPEDPRKEDRLVLSPAKERGWVHEIHVPLRAGDRVAYRSRAEAPDGGVAFNVHSHHGKEVRYHVREDDAGTEGIFVAPWSGAFYWMWENRRKEAVPLQIVLERVAEG